MALPCDFWGFDDSSKITVGASQPGTFVQNIASPGMNKLCYSANYEALGWVEIDPMVVSVEMRVRLVGSVCNWVVVLCVVGEHFGVDTRRECVILYCSWFCTLGV